MATDMKISDIPAAAISLAVAVIIVVVISLILVDVQKLQPDNTARKNESITFVSNNTEILLSQSNLVGGSLILYNGTGMITINLGNNYTVNTAGGGITLINSSDHGTSVFFNNTPGALVVNYTHFIGSAALNATDRGLESQQTYASFFPLVALAAIGGIVIGIIIRFFLRKVE